MQSSARHHTSVQLTVLVQVYSRRCKPCVEAMPSAVLAMWWPSYQGYTAGHHNCDLTACGRYKPACPHLAATLEQRSKSLTCSVHVVGDSEVELLCSDHTLPAALLHSFDSELWNLLQQSADEPLLVPIIDIPQTSTQQQQAQQNIQNNTVRTGC